MISFWDSSIAGYAMDKIAVMVLNGLEEQLGLKLESRKAPVEVLVIDRVEKRSEN